MTLLLAVCAVLTAILTVYALGHYLCALAFAAREKSVPPAGRPEDRVAVLIPAKDEAERAVRAILSARRQDHAGPVDVFLLVKDASDSSIPFLRSLYPGAPLDIDSARSPLIDGPGLVELERTPDRRVFVAFTGSDAKSTKVNWVVPHVEARWTAILDADHQAEPGWLRTSVAMLQQSGARAVQGRRAPLSALGFFPLWDSLHQHVGCELFNEAFSSIGLTVFFTGSTAVIDTDLLREQPLGTSITEDIDFSYGLLNRGIRFAHNPHAGSSEEVSPNLYSFLARRRRWANGHTAAFLRHLRAGATEPMGLAQRIQFLHHGSHYMVSLVVFALHLAIGVHFVGVLSLSSAIAALLTGILAGAWISRGQRTANGVGRAAEVAVLTAWVFPAVVIAMNLTQAFMVSDPARAALPIPYVLQAAGLVGLVAPLVVLVTGLAGFGQLGLGTFILVVLTYPLAFYVDLCGVLLGMSDWMLGQARWRPVARARPVASQKITIAGPISLLTPRHIMESWSVRNVLGLSNETIKMRLAMPRPSRLFLSGTIVLVFVAGVFYSPGELLGPAQGDCRRLVSDTDPWILPPRKLDGFCSGAQVDEGTRTGTFTQIRTDDFKTFDANYWDRLDDTFFCNLSTYSPDNATVGPGGLTLTLDGTPRGGKQATAGAIATKKNATYTYGRFEAVMKPSKTSGVLTALFLYRFDPWQEIDLEFAGTDTTRLLANVYYNPGEEGDLYNYGMHGTPAVIDLGFDASLDFHHYAIEWEANEIRWLVDGKLVHVRKEGRPTPIPHLPMRLHVSQWPNCSEKLVGPFSTDALPATTRIRSLTISDWHAAPFRGLLSRGDESEWRKNAGWIR